MPKGRVPATPGSREFGRKTRGSATPPNRRKPAAALPELSETERAQERIEAHRMRRDWLKR